MSGFASIAQRALQPSILEGLSPDFARGLLIRDLSRTGKMYSSRRAESEKGRRASWERATTPDQQHGFGFLSPQYIPPHYQAANPNQYMIDAIQRDAALAEYDRRAPEARRGLAAQRSAA